MNMMRVWAIARKESIHVLRDPRSLAMAFGIPMLMLVLFGYALTLDVDNVPIVVWDQSSTQTSRDLLARFEGSRYFSVNARAGNYRDVERAIDSGAAIGALIIPTDFAARLESGRDTSVQLIVDGSDSNRATIVLGYVNAVVMGYSQDASLVAARRIGVTLRAPLDVRPRAWFNAEMESKNYIVPGLIAVIMLVISALLTSLTVAREWERGTMEQLISTPIRSGELVMGKLLPYFAIGMTDVLVAVLMAVFVFDVPLRGSVVLLFLTAAIFLAGASSLGMLISIVTKSQPVAMQMAIILTFLPSFLLSGFMFAIANMPKPIQLVSHLVPATYFVSLLRGIHLKGVGLSVLWWEAGLLALFAVAMVLLANVAFKKRLE